MNDNRISVIPVNNATKNPYMNIAAAIIKSAIDDHDEMFFGQQWGKNLCEWLNVDADVAVSVSRKKYDRERNLAAKLYEEKKKVSVSKVAMPVICIETGKIYKSANDAAKDIHRNPSNILKCCQGKRITCAELHWEYYNV